MHLPTIMLPEADEDAKTEVFCKVAPLSTSKVEPVGRWFEAYCLRRTQKQTLSHTSLESSSSEASDANLSSDEDDENLLKTLDPKTWKEQDHYAVLGLSKLRYKATDDQIKRAYKKKVLRHHPDKRRARGIPVKDGEEDYFTCITRAWETLGVPAKRRSFDSVDPEFDDSIPDKEDGQEDFFGTFTNAFESNARWSNKKKVPPLGDDNTPFEEVDNFYGFWYDFESWREFSYLDEEEKEKGENRDERRWIEKQNKAERQKRKKEEVVRIRQLVDNAYATDPRIIRHREEKKMAKQREKDAKKEANRKRMEEEERKKQEILEAERKQREKEEEEARQAAAVLKKEKDVQKKAMKKERKILRNTIKDYEFFASDEAEHVQNMTDVERLADMLSLVTMQTLNQAITTGDKEQAKQAFLAGVAAQNAKIEEEKQEAMRQAQRPSQGAEGVSKTKGRGNWTEEEVQFLIKAVNLFPAGTSQRWETVSSFITQHVPSSNRLAKEVLSKAKDLQKNDQSLKEEANKKAFDKFSKDMTGSTLYSTARDKAEQEGLSERYISSAEAQIMETGNNPAPWTPEEQKLLEQGLKTFPASVADRWDKIANSLPDRSKKDCMKRYKELVEIIRAKKLAQIEAQKKAAKKM